MPRRAGFDAIQEAADRGAGQADRDAALAAPRRGGLPARSGIIDFRFRTLTRSCARDFGLWAGASSAACAKHVSTRDAARAKRPAQKKWPLRRAAKFREETPRKGGGFAIEDRDTALQQYAEVAACLQGAKYNNLLDKIPQKIWKNLSQLPDFSVICLLRICAPQ